MIRLVEGAERQKTPNEIALNVLLAGLTIIFVLAVATIPSFAAYAGGSIPIVVLVALFVALIPTTIGALLSAIGIAGMDRLVRFNVLGDVRARGRGCRRRRYAAARQDRHHHSRQPPGDRVPGRCAASTEAELADAAQLASLADETPEGRSIVVLPRKNMAFAAARSRAGQARFIPFTAQSRMSGVDIGGSWVRKGAVDAILTFLNSARRLSMPPDRRAQTRR